MTVERPEHVKRRHAETARQRYRPRLRKIAPAELTEETRRLYQKKIEARLLKDGEHWHWKGTLNSITGQAVLFKRSARRYVWLVYRGAIPADTLVRVGCSDIFCLNPAHIVLGRPGRYVRGQLEELEP